MGVTGVEEIDTLTGSTPPYWITEFYGNPRITSLVLHHTLAYQSTRGDVLYLHTVDFGGLDPFLVQSLSRMLGGDYTRIMVARGFRLGDSMSLLEEALENEGPETLVLGYPYNHIPHGVKGYMEATRLTGLIKRLANKYRVIIFNTTSKRGVHGPEGGNYHHHTTHVIVRLEKSRRKWWGKAILVKHPGRESGSTTYFSLARLQGVAQWVVQHPLSEWY